MKTKDWIRNHAGEVILICVMAIFFLFAFFMLPNAYASDSPDPIGENITADLTSTKIEVYDEDSGEFVEPADLTYQSGESCKLSFTFSVPASTSDGEVYFQMDPKVFDVFSFLPDTLFPLSCSVPDKNTGENLGTALWYEDGLVQFSLSDAFTGDNDGYQLYIEMGGEITDVSEKQQMDVPGLGKVTILGEPDLSVTKSSVVEDGSSASAKVIDYTVLVSSTNGTGGNPVSVTDTITSTSGMDMSLGSVSVYPKDSDTSLTGWSGSPSITKGTNSLTITLSDLPALGLDSGYRIVYSLTATLTSADNGQVNNDVSATSGSLTAEDAVLNQFGKPDLSLTKAASSYTPAVYTPTASTSTGGYDLNHGTISYTLTLSSVNGTDGEPVDVMDTLTIPDGVTAELDSSSVDINGSPYIGTPQISQSGNQITLTLTGLKPITTGGTDTITYTLDVTVNEAGTFNIENTADAVSGQLKKESSTTTPVSATNLQISKEASQIYAIPSYPQGYNALNYTKYAYKVRAYSSFGTGDNDVSLTDAANVMTIGPSSGILSDTLSMSYISAALTLELPDGTSQSVDGWTQAKLLSYLNNNETITGLPPLKAGESYVLDYVIAVKGELIVTSEDQESNHHPVLQNMVQSQAGSESSDSPSISMPVGNAKMTNTTTGNALQKQGTTYSDQPYGWPTVNNMNNNVGGAALNHPKMVYWSIYIPEAVTSGMFNDSLPDGMQLESKVYVVATEDADGNSISPTVIQTESSLNFMLTNVPAGSYIEFYTSYGTLEPGETATNSAFIINFSSGTVSSATGSVSPASWSVSKNFEKFTKYEGSEASMLWSVKVGVADGDTDPIVIKDTLGAENISTGTSADGIHSCTVGEATQAIEDSLQMTIPGPNATSLNQVVGWENDYQISCVLTFYDQNGNVVTASNAEAYSYELSITYNGNYKPLSLSYSYMTNIDLSDVSGDTIQATNTATAGGVSSTAQSDDLKLPEDSVSKTVSYGSKLNVSGDSLTTYQDTDGEISYSITVPVTSARNMTIVDTMNTDLKPQNIQASFNDTDATQYITPEITQKNGKTILTITVDGKSILEQSIVPTTLTITYTLPISEDSRWTKGSQISQQYENSVAYGSSQAQTTTTVVKTKTGSVSSNTGSSYTADYQLVINPNGTTYGDSDLTVTDTLGTAKGLVSSIDTDSIQLYKFDPTAADGKGSLISTDQYSYTYDAATKTITLKVPDGMALLLCYSYKVTNIGSSSDTSLENSYNVKSSDTVEESSSASVIIPAAAPTAYADQFQLTLNKVQSGDHTIVISGAEFELQQYNLKTGSWDTIQSGLVTDSAGKITFNNSQSSLFSVDTLYRFVETKLPAGYAYADGSDGNTYFVLLNNQKGNTQTQDQAESAMKTAGYPEALLSEAEYLENGTVWGGSLTVENTKTAIEAKKVWTDADGVELTGSQIKEDSVQFELLRGTVQDMSQAAVVDGSQKTADSSNDWTVSWDNEPAQDASGHTYYYFVKEVSVPGGWKVQYVGNGGVTSGTVKVINQQEVAVTLPKTDGVTDSYSLAAAFLLGLAALTVFLSERKTAN